MPSDGKSALSMPSECTQIFTVYYKTRQFFYIDYESDIFLSFSHCVIGLASEQERQDYVVHTRNEWVATFFSLSVG